MLRRLGALLAVSPALLGEEPLERFLRLALGVLVATAFLVEMFSVTGCTATTTFRNRNLQAAMVAMNFVARGSTDTPLGDRPRVLLAAEASLKEPAALSESATWRFDRPAFGRPWLASTCFFAMASPLRISMSRQSSIPKRSLCSSALPLAGKKGSRLTSGANGEPVSPGSFLGLLDRPKLFVQARTEQSSPPTRPKVFIGGRDPRISD
ncbi:hypothetical protein HPB51_028586 [Rhipicephalus microplus]|uniref:Uncharacterized protein n=1 Tax=Rhipicephalus microplus TaxID=6941 RepID=A0A9J6CX61_RHIMP|nr:hypothetical protein HPB51_028586 [Rhipicephalus microplus]